MNKNTEGAIKRYLKQEGWKQIGRYSHIRRYNWKCSTPYELLSSLIHLSFDSQKTCGNDYIVARVETVIAETVHTLVAAHLEETFPVTGEQFINDAVIDFKRKLHQKAWSVIISKIQKLREKNDGH